MKAPWWMCCGWWSPWCVLDIANGCKVPWICDRHDRALERKMARDERLHPMLGD